MSKSTYKLGCLVNFDGTIDVLFIFFKSGQIKILSLAKLESRNVRFVLIFRCNDSHTLPITIEEALRRHWWCWWWPMRKGMAMSPFCLCFSYHWLFVCLAREFVILWVNFILGFLLGKFHLFIFSFSHLQFTPYSS